MVKKGTIHWTAGKYTANASDREHYHLLIEWRNRQPSLLKAHNLSEKLNHTFNRNTDNVAIAVCGMIDATTGNFGECPITEKQIDMLIETAALVSILKVFPPDKWRTHAEYAIEDGYGPGSGDPETKWDFTVVKPIDKNVKLSWKSLTGATATALRIRIIDRYKYLKDRSACFSPLYSIIMGQPEKGE